MASFDRNQKWGQSDPKNFGNLTKLSTRSTNGPPQNGGSVKNPYFCLTILVKSNTVSYKLLPINFMAGLTYTSKHNGNRTINRPNNKFMEYVTGIIKGEKNNGTLAGVLCAIISSTLSNDVIKR